MLDGIEYRNKNSEESKELDEKIRKEVQNKLEFLRKIKNELKSLEKIKAKSPKDKARKKEQIFISQEIGIYKNQNNKKLNYPIKGRRAKVLMYLSSGKKDGNLLAKAIGIEGSDKLQKLSKDIGDINRIFRKKLKLKHKIIVHVETGGYKLNEKDYKIKFV